MLKWYLYVTSYYYFDENLEDKEDQNRNILPTKKKSFNFIRIGMFRRQQLLKGNNIVNDDVIHLLVHIFLNT